MIMYLFLKLFNQKCFQFFLILIISTIHLIVTPFSKVEESFQLQAAHDFLNIGFPKFYQCVYISLITGQLEFDTNKCWSKIENLDDKLNQSNLFNILPKPKAINYKKWDHEEFPGVVPRTFIPSFILSLICLPFKLIVKENIIFQILVRLNLAILIILSMLNLSENLTTKFGNYTGSLFITITCTQFHFIFYSSRTLPNTFALLLCILGYSFWLRKQFTYLIILSAFSVLIFRFETSIIFGTIFLIELFQKKRINFLYFLFIGILSGLIAILTTVLFDSFIWGRFIWPEFESMYFNLYLNKSHLWGIQPFYWYFLVAIPKTMLFSLPLIFFKFQTNKCLLKFYPIILMHVGLHSLLPHKELRFIIYIIPLLNICVAYSISNLFKIIDSSFDDKLEQKNNIVNELNRIYDTKDFSSYRTFQKEDLKELEKIRPQLRKENQIRRRKLNNSNTNSGGKNNLLVSEYVLSYNKSGLLCDGYDYLKGICNSKLKNKSNIDLNELSLLKEDIDKQKKQNNEENKTDKEIENKDLKTDDQQQQFTLIFIIQFMCIILHLCLNFAASTFILFISFYNYPGGDAVIWLNDNLPKHLNQFQLNTSDVGIHVGNLAAQTGFTRFAEWQSIAYDKSPDFLKLTTGFEEQSKKQSLNLDLTKYKLVYLILDNIKPEFLNQYCNPIKSSNQSSKLPYSINKFECNFNRLKRCRINSVVYGFYSVHLKLDSKFLNISKIPMLYIYRCGV